MNEPDALVEEVFKGSSASTWLREALRTALERDPVDALNDVLALANILETRLKVAYGIS